MAFDNPINETTINLCAVATAQLLDLSKTARATWPKFRTGQTQRVHIKNIENGIKITLTDFDIWIESYIKTDCLDFPPSTFTLNELMTACGLIEKKATVKLTISDKAIMFETSGQFIMFSNVMDTENCTTHTYATPQFEPDIIGQLPANLVHNALDIVKPSISTEETRYHLNGVFVEYCTNDYALHFVATDGHRLSRYTQGDYLPQQINTTSDGYGNIIPKQAIAAIARIAGNYKDSNCTFATMNNYSQFAFDYHTVTTKNIDGSFPSYRRVIPNTEYLTIKKVTDRKALLKALKNLKKATREKEPSARLEFTDSLTITDPDYNASFTTQLTLDAGSCPEPITIGFSPQYIIDALSKMTGDKVTIHIGDTASPTVFSGHDAQSTVVIMPLRV